MKFNPLSIRTSLIYYCFHSCNIEIYCITYNWLSNNYIVNCGPTVVQRNFSILLIIVLLIESDMRKCKLCGTGIKGRQGKVFCSVKCKSSYHYQLRAVTDLATDAIDKILHRNRSILLEILGKNSSQKKVDRKILDRKKFNFNYMTSFYRNSKNKLYHIVYDFAWMEFTDGEILIVKRK